MKRSSEDWIIDIVVYAFMIFVLVATLYPVLYELSLSLSSADAIGKKHVWLLPVELTWDSYRVVLESKNILTSFLNSIFYTVVGTGYSMILTIMGGYVFSRKKFFGRDFCMLLIAFTMLFGGGLIPTFLLVKGLGLYGSRWALIIPCAVSVYNLVIMRTAMQQLPPEIEESGKMDGANEFTILFKLIIPMSMPAIAAVTLFYAVGKWNDFFSGMIYLFDEKKYPLQLVAREILLANEDLTFNVSQSSSSREMGRNFTSQGFQAAVVIVTVLPLLIVYPFLQKYFVKGVMIGAIKG